MPLQPRGTQRWSRPKNESASEMRRANSRVPMTGEERAAAFLAHARQARSNKIATGSAEAESKGQERRMKLMQFRNIMPAAKSVAHRGVVERPMDEGLSKMLEQKRQELRERGTSVARVNQHAGVEAEADRLSPETDETLQPEERESPRPEDHVMDELQTANEERLQTGTSVGRFRSAKKDLKLKDKLLPKPSLGDMEI